MTDSATVSGEVAVIVAVADLKLIQYLLQRNVIETETVTGTFTAMVQ